jgi:hypothetical protein
MSTNETTETPKAPEIVRETIQAEYRFTTEEQIALGQHLTRAHRNIEQIDAQFSSVKQEFKGRITNAELERDGILRKLEDGYEMRSTVAVVLYNTPTPGRKTYVRDDNGEFIREDAMTYSDQERPLFKDKDGRDATVPQSGEFLNDIDGDGTREDLDRVADTSPAGTPIGAALNAAAAASDEAKILIENFDAKDWEAPGLVKAAKAAMKKAQWSQASIGTMMDVLRGCDTVTAMRDALRNHVIDAPESGEESEA